MKSLIGYLALLAFFVSTPVPANASVRNGPGDSKIISAFRIDPEGRIVCSGVGPEEAESLSYLRRPDPDLDTRLTYSASEDGGIRLQFSGVPAQAQEAIVFAASVWERYLVIDVPFTLRFRWRSLRQPLQIGGPAAWTIAQWETGPGGSFSRKTEDSNMCYPNPLARQILGRPVGADPSFTIDIHPDLEWYFGTDTNTPSDPLSLVLNLVSVVIHEIGHAIGFFSGAGVDYDAKTARLSRPDGCQLYFDEFIWMPGFGDLRFQNSHPTQRLFEALSSDIVLWGKRTKTANTNFHQDPLPMAVLVNGGPIVLHTSESNNITTSHLSQGLFGNTIDDHIMTPYTNRTPREPDHTIGPVTLAMLYDIGWKLKPRSPNQASCLVPIKPNPPKNAEMDFFWNPGRLQISWEIEPPATRSRVRGKGPGDDWSRWFEIDETSFEYEYSRFQGRKGRWSWEIAAGTDLDVFSDAVSMYYYYD